MQRKSWLISGILLILILVCVASTLGYQGYLHNQKQKHIQALQEQIEAFKEEMEAYVTQEEYAKADAVAAELFTLSPEPEIEKRRKEIDQLWLKQRLHNNVTYWKEFEAFYKTP